MCDRNVPARAGDAVEAGGSRVCGHTRSDSTIRPAVVTSLTAAAAALDYIRRGWSLVPIPPREKGPRIAGWQSGEFAARDFAPGGNVGLILGPRSAEIVDIDLDCPEALALADIYLVATGAVFGRASKQRSHRLYVAPGAIHETFVDPASGSTILELRAAGRAGGAHQTVIPPSVHPSGEAIEWYGNAIAPAVIAAEKLRRRCAYLAIGSLVMRYVSETAARNPGPDLSRLLWETDHAFGRAAYRWLGQPAPDEPRHGLVPRPRTQLSPEENDLAELLREIPNEVGWEGWNNLGLAIYAACGGSDRGEIVFDAWSAKSPKYDPYTTAARWRHFHRSPPNRTGIGKIIKLALEAGWRPAKTREWA
jgi:hypothetical protein